MYLQGGSRLPGDLKGLKTFRSSKVQSFARLSERFGKFGERSLRSLYSPGSTDLPDTLSKEVVL